MLAAVGRAPIDPGGTAGAQDSVEDLREAETVAVPSGDVRWLR
jgi:hypothetical protein